MTDAAARPHPRGRDSLAWAPWIMFCFVWMTLWFVMTFVVLGDVFATAGRAPLGAGSAALLVFFQLLCVLLLLSTGFTAFTAPGHIPSWLRSEGTSAEVECSSFEYTNLLQARERKRDGTARYCRKTQAFKPDRAHYCPQAGQCVLQFQEFSRSFNSALGFYNYKYYLLSLFYGTIIPALIVAVALPQVVASWPSGDVRSLLGSSAGELARRLASLATERAPTVVTVLSAVVISVILVLLIAPQLALHLHLVATGRTLYEWQQIRAGTRPATRSRFDYGMLNNFLLTFGAYPLLWLLPTRHGVEGNGIFFPEQEESAEEPERLASQQAKVR